MTGLIVTTNAMPQPPNPVGGNNIGPDSTGTHPANLTSNPQITWIKPIPVISSTKLGHPSTPTDPHQPDERHTIYFNDRPLLQERIVHQSALDKLGHGFRQTFVELPKAAWRGLRGDADYSAGDFYLLGNVPYYLGGATLAAIFASGRHGLTLTRQGPAIVMYYLAIAATQSVINQWVKSQTGVDLGLKYRTSMGDLKPVYGDPTFSRYDLISEETYQHIAKKLGLPENLTDTDDEVQTIIAEMLPRIRLAKTILGNTLATIAAGYLARTDAWAGVFSRIPGMSWQKHPVKRTGRLLKDATQVIFQQVTGENHARGMRLSSRHAHRVQGVALGLLLAGIALTGQLLRHLVPKKHYEPANWAPSTTVNPTYLTPTLNKARDVWQQDQQRALQWVSIDSMINEQQRSSFTTEKSALHPFKLLDLQGLQAQHLKNLKNGGST